MDRYGQRTMVRLGAWLLGIAGAICYGAYKANPALAIGCVVGIAALGGASWAVARHKEKQVEQMVANVEAGADRYITGDDA